MRAKLLIAVLAACAVGCLALVLSSQYASGNIYSEYSSLRTDRMGTAALYEALNRIYPAVARNETRLPSLGVSGSEVLILGLSPFALTAEYMDELEALAKAGNRIVVALDGGEYVFDAKRLNAPISAKWHLRLIDQREHRDEQLPSDRFLFERAAKSGWELQGANVTRAFGKGSVLLMGSSWAFTNAALREDRNLAELNSAIGSPARILFDETHLGSEEQGSLMALARRFRLQGVIAVSLICALLFIWQASSPFPPEQPAAPDADVRLAAASAGEGLQNLLAHHIPANRVVAACVAEWRKDRGRLAAPDTIAQMEAIAARKAHPAEQWREIRELLRKRK
jgi:hypothetical protein